MAKKNEKVTYRPKRKRQVTTIDDILARDDVTGILEKLSKERANIKEMVVIYIDSKEEKSHWMITANTYDSTATWMLESTKLDILSNDREDE